ncbi:MAG: rane protein, partial [Microbacteriaceae bacterium]|nr:rane protein [Microbacteriaceae bacterium]
MPCLARGRPQPMRLVITLLLAMATAVGIVVVPTAALAVSTTASVVEFSPGDSGLLRPGRDLLLSGSVSNPTNVAIPESTATVYLNRVAVSSRTDLAAWLDSPDAVTDDKLGAVVSTSAIPSVPPGRTITVSITV